MQIVQSGVKRAYLRSQWKKNDAGILKTPEIQIATFDKLNDEESLGIGFVSVARKSSFGIIQVPLSESDNSGERRRPFVCLSYHRLIRKDAIEEVEENVMS